jgi:putative peptidoglycan lipid II flippase
MSSMLKHLRSIAVRAGLPLAGAGSRPTLLADSIRATAGSIAGLLPGFFIPIALALLLGADAATDTFFLALSVATLIGNTAGTAMQQVAIPFLVAAKGEKADVGRFVGEMALTLLVLAVLLAAVANLGVLALARHWLQWSPEQTELLRNLLWLLGPYVVCSVLSAVYSAALAADHRYVGAALSPAARSLVVLAAVLFAPRFGIYVVAVGFALGEVLRLVLLLRAARRGQPLALFAWPSRGILSRFHRSAGALLVGSGLLASLPVVDRAMASSLGAGNVSLLEYADRFWQFPVNLALSGFVITSLSHWSHRLQDHGSRAALARDTRRVALGLFVLFLPLALGVVLFGRPLVHLVLGGGDLAAPELDRLADTLKAFVAVVPIYVGGLVYTRAFLVLNRSDWLLAINLVQIVVKIGLNVLLMPTFGIVGLAVATSATYATSSVLLVVLFHMRLLRFGASPPAVR